MHNYFRCSLESKRFSSSLSLIFPLFFSQMLVNTSLYDVFEILFHTEPYFFSLSHFSLTILQRLLNNTSGQIAQLPNGWCTSEFHLVSYTSSLFRISDLFFFFSLSFSFTSRYRRFLYASLLWIFIFFSFLNTIVFSLIRFLLYLVVGSDYLTMIPHYFQRNRKHGVLQL